MKLMIASNFFNKGSVIFKQNKETQKIQKIVRSQNSAYKGFQFVELSERIKGNSVNGAPGHESLNICGKRSH